MKNIKICVYGAASDKIDPLYMREVEKLGTKIGYHGHTLIYGAGATGLMGACARGVASVDGTIIGIVPEFMEAYEGLYHDCTQMIKTQTMAERKKLMEEKADAFVIVPGGIGTMDEFFQILTLADLDRKKAPIVVYNVAGFYNSILDFIDQGIAKGFIGERVRSLFTVEDTSDDVLNAIEEAL